MYEKEVICAYMRRVSLYDTETNTLLASTAVPYETYR